MQSYDIAAYGAPLERFERATPQPTGTEVLVRVSAAGVCHSDLHIWEGFFDLGSGKKLTMASRGMQLPHTLGHETAGEVVALGPKAEGVRIGQQSLVYPWIGCGACEVCRMGEEQLCMTPRFLGIHRAGGYSDHILVPHPRYVLDISDLPATEAAPYACSGLTTFAALTKLGPQLKTRPTVIIGAGGLGLMALSLLKAMKGKGAVVVDIDPAKREAALKAGAIAAIDANAPDAMGAIKAAAGGAVWSVLDLVGSHTSAQLGIDLLNKGGKYVIVGLFGGDITLSLPPLAQRGITIQGSYVGSPAELKALLELIRKEKVAPIPIQTRPLADASAALEDLKAGRVLGRTILTP